MHFTKAADKVGVPQDLRNTIMSMTGTIIVKDNNVHFFESLAQDEKAGLLT
ncbi:hypothetical protein MHYMCMPASI_01145 [Hyalomma marginatum]|uniref:Uncharacterized protein n=1 Tax=Hyalomma marginatum TaxID=34627 RepID=A0A8S4C3I4_9ACAR|nr:hypothetical protein MHYMCMPASI_01145 [Hyalomma marginatum]